MNDTQTTITVKAYGEQYDIQVIAPHMRDLASPEARERVESAIGKEILDWIADCERLHKAVLS